MAKKDADAIAKLFDDPTELRRDPHKAAKNAGGSDELAEFFGSLDSTEIDTLAKAHDELSRIGVRGKSDGGATVTFL